MSEIDTTGRAGAMFCRRTLLGAAAAAGGASLLGAPFVAKRARASSGTVNVFAWGDYVQTFNEGGLSKQFTDKTGIQVQLSTYGSNDELENKLRASGGKGFDIVFPSVDTGPNYYKDGLLAPIDESKFKVDQVIPSIYKSSVLLGATHRGKRHLIPFDWGTEAITWDSEKHPDLAYGNLSYGDMWKDDLAKQVAMRQKSVLVSLALYLDAIGEVKSDRGMDLVKSEEESRRVFEAATKWAIAKKDVIGAYWNNATEATSAFTDAGCTIGQTWDTTGILLHRDTAPKWRYSMPKEGGLAWTDTIAIPAGAENVEQAYAFIDFMLTPEAGAVFSNNTGYNSCAVGADQHLSEENKAAFAMAYPDEAAVDNLWWWPPQTPFFAALRTEYVEKLTNA
ncbi:extracellular solute-binding protein [Geminicoccus roseus]|uniref:extracellular solute-binding protein n=1 Tax=Geminicoccus roseus TaxID=404900 RepID=UPI0003FAD37F|nr:extracellular solute-binding protein [Geminicoccus roseus]